MLCVYLNGSAMQPQYNSYYREELAKEIFQSFEYTRHEANVWFIEIK